MNILTKKKNNNYLYNKYYKREIDYLSKKKIFYLHK